MKKIMIVCLLAVFGISLNVYAGSFAKIGDNHRFHIGLGNKRISINNQVNKDVTLFGGEMGLTSNLLEYPAFNFNSVVKFGYYAGSADVNQEKDVSFSDTSFGAGLSLSKELGAFHIESGVLGTVDYLTMDYSADKNVGSTGVEPFMFINANIFQYWGSDQNFNVGVRNSYTRYFNNKLDDSVMFMGTIGFEF